MFETVCLCVLKRNDHCPRPSGRVQPVERQPARQSVADRVCSSDSSQQSQQPQRRQQRRSRDVAAACSSKSVRRRQSRDMSCSSPTDDDDEVTSTQQRHWPSQQQQCQRPSQQQETADDSATARDSAGTCSDDQDLPTPLTRPSSPDLDVIGLRRPTTHTVRTSVVNDDDTGYRRTAGRRNVHETARW